LLLTYAFVAGCVVGFAFDVDAVVAIPGRLSPHQTPRIGVRVGGLPPSKPSPGECYAACGGSNRDTTIGTVSYSKHRGHGPTCGKPPRL